MPKGKLILHGIQFSTFYFSDYQNWEKLISDTVKESHTAHSLSPPVPVLDALRIHKRNYSSSPV
jgi:hypothetical protein